MKSILTFLFLVLAQVLLAQKTNFLDKKQIDCQEIKVCCQDQHNFLWFGTDKGLRRFDGTQFVAYYHNDADSTSLASNNVMALLIDREQRLWVGTNDGLQRYVPEKDCFQTVRLHDASIGGYITSIIERKNGEILFVVSGMGLFRLDADAMVGYKVVTLNEGYHPRYLYNLFEDSRQRLWLGTDREGVICVDGETKKEKLYALPPTSVKGMLEDRHGCLYVVTNYTVYKWDAAGDRFRPLPYRGTKTDFTFNRVLLTADGTIVIGTGGDGLMQIVNGSEEITDSSLYNPFVDANRVRVSFLFEDKLQNLWIGCQYQGLLMLPNTPMPFLFMDKPVRFENVSGKIAALFCDKEGTLWCSIENDGIYRLDSEGNTQDYIPAAHTAGAMFEDSSGTFWVGVNGQGLYTLDRSTMRLQLRYPVEGDYVISSIIEDGQKNLYASVMGLGVLRYRLSTGEFRMCGYQTPLTRREELVNFWITSLCCDSGGRIWTGHHGGVSCYDTRQQTFLRLPFREWVRVSTYCVTEAKDHKIWLGMQKGLLCYDPESGKYEMFTVKQGLPDNIVQAVVEDENGGIWCSTAQGIAHIASGTRKVTSYYTGNGLEDKVYLSGCRAQCKSGTIYFGGEKGITCFNPNDIRPVRQDKAPCITEMFIRNQKVTLQTCSGGNPVVDRSIVEADRFHLSATDNNFAFHVSTMNFRDERNVIYEYRMEELEPMWNQTRPGEGRIQYTYLSPGTYTLEIRACENGMFSPVKSVQVCIAPPWYWSTVAKLVYTLFIIGVGYLLYIAAKRKRREEIGEMKLQFFINIAHEIRSPLTLMTSPLEKLLKKDNDADTNKSLQTIKYNTNRILNLLNQLLDIRRIDKGQMIIRCVETDMQAFINELLDVFSEQAKQKDIRLEAEFAERLPKVWIDPNNFDKVLVNLLTNALKYTPSGGTVEVCVKVGHDVHESGALQDYMEISISDTGKGLSEKELKKIFERFYQGGANQATTPLGFGIGLNLCQSLVKLHHGVIFAENRKEVKGSRFVVRLPLGCKHLRKEELASSEETVPYAVREEVKPEYDWHVETEKGEKSRTNYHVLVIDDDDDLRKFLVDSLSVYYRVDTAINGMDGLKKAITKQPDIVISDVMMPAMDGIQMLKELKKNINTNHIPVILLTSKTEFANRIEGLEQGADAYLGKPFSVEELHTLIGNLIANRIRLKGKYSGSSTQEGKRAPIVLQSSDEVLMERIMKVINKNLNNPMLSVEMLTQEVGMSRTHLHRRIKGMTGLTPSDFIRNIRLIQAAELLKKKDITVTQVAYTVGFSSQTHFSSAFKKMYGISPTEYKEANEE